MFRKMLLLNICLTLINNWVWAQDSTQIYWEEFYPLHIGDFWKYFEQYGPIPVTYTKKVIGRNTMPNNQIYAKILCINHTFRCQGYEYQRVDSLGDVYKYNVYENKDILLYKLNVAIGDTWPDRFMGYWRVDDESQTIVWGDTVIILVFRLYDSILDGDWTVVEGLGVSGYGFEGGYGLLVGAIVNGRVYGDTTVSVKEKEAQKIMPETITLYQNYPNPFNFSTHIRYELPKGGEVILRIFNINGELVKTIVNQSQEGGEYEVIWNGSNEAGKEVASGIYLCQLQVGNQRRAKRLLLLK